MEITQTEREMAIQTILGENVLVLRSMSVQEELGRLFSIQVELLSLKENIKFEDLLGTNATIRLKLAGEGKRFFNGHITSFAQTSNQGAYTVYEATIHPWLWFLTRTADCRIFQQKTIPDIIKSVFRDLGYTDFQEKLTNSYPVWDYCVQYRETDFNFVSRLMEQAGIYYYFQHQDGKHELILADNYGSHQPLPGTAKISFYPPDEAAVKKEEFCSHWYISKQVMPGKYVLDDFDFKRPSANLQVNSVVARSHAVSDYEVFDYPGEYEKIGDGNGYVKLRIEELHAQYEQARGQSDVRAMQAGGLFTLAEYPREDQNREYLVVSATHNIQSDAFESQSKGAALYSNSFYVINSKTPFRPARTTPKPQIQGPQTAIVVGPSGEEIYTDEHGRVKLQFHWDRYGKSDENSSCWVRVSQVWAGKSWGAMHIPRIGQEVIVEFLEGDPDRPIITGRVYNGEQTVPYGLPANKTQSGIKSRSSKGGAGGNFNEIRMEDKKGSEELYIHAEKNHTNITENDRSEDVGHDRALHVGHDKSEKVDNNKTITVGVDHTETIGSNKTLDVGAKHTEAIGSDMKIDIGANLKETVGASLTQDVSMSADLTVGMAHTLSVGTTSETKAGMKLTLTVGLSTIEMTPASIKISCGASSIMLTPASVAVTAPLVSLNG